MGRKKYLVKLTTVSECGVWDHEEIREVYGEDSDSALESALWEVTEGLWGPPPGCRVLISLVA